MPRRSDSDQRGHGVSDAAQLVPGARELVAAFSQSDWVAERPEIHLRPHVEAWCQRDQHVALVGENTNDVHAYVLDLEWRGAKRSVGEARAAIFSLIGSFAESATYVRQHRVNGEGSTTKLRFEIGTGELGPDARFAPHGHLVALTWPASSRHTADHARRLGCRGPGVLLPAATRITPASLCCPPKRG